jgi:hypothetical protein
LNQQEIDKIRVAAERNTDGGSAPGAPDAPGAACGNGRVDPDETCDPPGSCPTSCPDIGCTRRRMEGAAATCNARCVDDGQQTMCRSGDGCCPAGCTEATDKDCSCVCGNGVKEDACGETCDPRESCPASCAPEGCALKRVVNAGTCQAVCVKEGLQQSCVNGDGCCPSICHAGNDDDCLPRCGNGVREGNEICDGDCPGSCPAVGCQRRKLEGDPKQCNARCLDDGTISTCVAGDSCCASGCTSVNDADCSCRCGNGVVEKNCGETCEGSGCPTSCPQMGCDLFRLQGSGCTATCVRTGAQSACKNGDGCCPSGCNARNDQDCPPRCGNGVVETGEQCDPVSACRMASEACTSDASTIRMPSGSVEMCTFRCQTMPRPCGAAPDGMCPMTCAPCAGNCAPNQDIDCRLNNGAACTQNNQCPGTCTDGRCCTQSCAVCQACTGPGGTCVPLRAREEDNVPAGACTADRSCDGSAAGQAACKKDDGQTCTGNDDCAGGACTTFFGDGDGDGQVDAAGTRFCGATPPAGFQATPGPDCCDLDPDIKVGAVALLFVPTPNRCGHFDYDCADGEQKQFTGTANCDLASCDSGWAPGVAVPACGQPASFIECRRHNIGNTTFCDQLAPADKPQPCR